MPPSPKKEKNNAAVFDALELLSLFQSGTLTVRVNGVPTVKVDGEGRALELETRGIKEFGLKLSKLGELAEGGARGGIRGMLSTSERAARHLSSEGWTMSLYDNGSRVLKMGRGAPSLTGHIEVNLWKLRKLVGDL